MFFKNNFLFLTGVYHCRSVFIQDKGMFVFHTFSHGYMFGDQNSSLIAEVKFSLEVYI